MKKFFKTLYTGIAFTGLWLVPFLLLMIKNILPSMSQKTSLFCCVAVMAWTTFNNVWSVFCEGKRVSEIRLGDGLIPDNGLKKESPYKRMASYPKVPGMFLSKQPEGIILGAYKNRYVRVPAKEILHSCMIGGSGSGKTSTVILDTLLANFASGKPEKQKFLTFAIDIKGELHEKSTYAHSSNIQIVNPSDRTSTGWDVYYRLRDNPGTDRIIESMEEIAQALIVSTNLKDRFFVENARTMFTGLLIYYFKQGESFIDSVGKILETELKGLLAEIAAESTPSDLWYKYLAKFAGKDAESVEDCMVEMTTSLSVFSKSDVKYCFRDNMEKASPASLREGKSVFLAVPEHLLESYQAVMRLCTAQVLQDLQRRPEGSSPPILVLIDEFARLGRVEIIFQALATLRSRQVMIMLAFQSLAQCEVIYSEAETRVLTENCRIKIICECSDPKTSKTISDWCGKYREKKETLTGGKGRHKSYSYEDKPIVEASDLITLVQKGEEILILPGAGYLRPDKCYYFKDKQLSALSEKVRAYNQQAR